MRRWLGSLFKDSEETSDRETRSFDAASLTPVWDWLGYEPTHPELFYRALRHRSVVDSSGVQAHETYERLEFLGDAVLDLVITEILFEAYPERNEGFLTKLRARMVKGETLGSLARQLGLDEHIEVGERSAGQGIEISRSVLADVFEALVAAIYVSEGYQEVFRFIESTYREHLDIDKLSVTVDNFKSELLEWTQARRKPYPDYRVLKESGPGHDKTFVVGVFIEGEQMGSGEGKSKKQAEQDAAQEAWFRIRGTINRDEPEGGEDAATSETRN
ncbi:MAG: ribonuclease III [Bacteroidota bacterium]